MIHPATKAVKDALATVRAHRGTFTIDLLGGRRYAVTLGKNGWTVEGFDGITAASGFELIIGSGCIYLSAITLGKRPGRVVKDVMPSDIVRITLRMKETVLDLYRLDASVVLSDIIDRMEANPGAYVWVELDDGNRIGMSRDADGWTVSTRSEDGTSVKEGIGPRVAVHGTPNTLELFWDFDPRDRPTDGMWFEKESVVSIVYAEASSAVPKTCWEVPA